MYGDKWRLIDSYTSKHFAMMYADIGSVWQSDTGVSAAVSTHACILFVCVMCVCMCTRMCVCCAYELKDLMVFVL